MDWIARLPLTDAASVATLRAEPGVEVATDGEWLWLRRDGAAAERIAQWKQVPGLQRYRHMGADRLARDGKTVPELALPDLDWQPILAFFPVALPRAGLPAMRPERCTIRLTRSNHPRSADGLLLDFKRFARFCATAPMQRLRRLAFARCSDGRCLVRGRPLPPLPGTPLYFEAQLAIPCGYGYTPALPASAVAKAFASVTGADLDGICLLHPDAPWEWLPGEHFVATTRAAVRATAESATDTDAN